MNVIFIIGAVLNGLFLFSLLFFLFREIGLFEKEENGLFDAMLIINIIGDVSIFTGFLTILMSEIAPKLYLISTAICFFIVLTIYGAYFNTFHGKYRILKFRIKRIDSNLKKIKRNSINATEKTEAIKVIEKVKNNLEKQASALMIQDTLKITKKNR